MLLARSRAKPQRSLSSLVASSIVVTVERNGFLPDRAIWKINRPHPQTTAPMARRVAIAGFGAWWMRCLFGAQRTEAVDWQGDLSLALALGAVLIGISISGSATVFALVDAMRCCFPI
jgi:hypothetical protein